MYGPVLAEADFATVPSQMSYSLNSLQGIVWEII